LKGVINKPIIGGTHTAILSNDGRIGPYITVKDIDASIAVVNEKGAEITLPPMELPGEGRCAIYILHGLSIVFGRICRYL
jgi:predicted enzyme related to lactoylglutathione lyase